ncbi:uncharacterized mitochondrial protein AtMg00810-like [Nicotiana sylvestris]|uniref:uncharacterized mitochondrial protein AtMg00810-like n=1 Tax=Nicotiana sylvestris TaxID=4096 RepID=UPI00388C6462
MELEVYHSLINSDFTRSKLDYFLFTKRQDTYIDIILVYVDDFLITGSDIKLIAEAKHILNNNFKMKDLGELQYFLGIEFARSSKGVLMKQRIYALELISECGLKGGKPAITLLEQNQKLTSLEYDKLFELDNDKEMEDRRHY